MSMTPAATDHSPTLTADGADLLALVELALQEAKVLGASQAEAAISMDVGLSVSARLGEVETIEYQRDRGMGVTVYFGTRKGSASTGDLGAAALRETVAKACTIARFTAEDSCAGLPDPQDLAQRRAVARSLAPLGHFARTGLRDGDRMRSGGDGRRSGAHHQLRGRGVSARIAACAPTATRWASSPPIPARCTASAARCSAAPASRWSATTGTARCATGASWNRRRASGAARASAPLPGSARASSRRRRRRCCIRPTSRAA